MHSEETVYIEPDYSSDEPPFDSGDDDDDDDIFPYDDDEEDITELQNKQNEKLMADSTPFQSPPWASAGQQSTPFGNNVQPTFPWATNTQTSSSPWAPAGTRVQQTQQNIIVPTTAIRIERPKKHVIIDMFDGIIESLTSEGKPNIPPRAPYDIKLRFDVWQSIASFSPHYVYCIIPPIPGDVEVWDTTFRYITSSLAYYLRIPVNNCSFVSQGRSGKRKEDTLRGILSHVIPENERANTVYIGIYSGYYSLGNEDLIAAKHCNIEYADIYQLLKGEI